MGDIIKIILALILPPIAVLVDRGLGKQLLLNIILTLFGYLPGIIHAVYLIGRTRREGPDMEPPTVGE